MICTGLRAGLSVCWPMTDDCFETCLKAVIIYAIPVGCTVTQKCCYSILFSYRIFVISLGFCHVLHFYVFCFLSLKKSSTAKHWRYCRHVLMYAIWTCSALCLSWPPHFLHLFNYKPDEMTKDLLRVLKKITYCMKNEYSLLREGLK